MNNASQQLAAPSAPVSPEPEATEASQVASARRWLSGRLAEWAARPVFPASLKSRRGQTLAEQAQAVYAKLTSCQFCRQRPDDVAGFLATIQTAMARQTPIACILGHGPLKNPNNTPAPTADWAECFTYGQLLRLNRAIAALYPPGLSVELILDDARAQAANGVSPTLTQVYHESVERLIGADVFAGVIRRATPIGELYRAFDHARYLPQAHAHIDRWMADPQHAESLALYRSHARTNLPAWRLREAADPEAVIDAAVHRYLTWYEAEKRCGLWHRPDTIALRYSPHVGACQIFTLRKGSVSQPWQGQGALQVCGPDRFDPTLLTRARRENTHTVAMLRAPDEWASLGALPLVMTAVAGAAACHGLLHPAQSASASRFY